MLSNSINRTLKIVELSGRLTRLSVSSFSDSYKSKLKNQMKQKDFIMSEMK